MNSKLDIREWLSQTPNFKQTSDDASIQACFPEESRWL